MDIESTAHALVEEQLLTPKEYAALVRRHVQTVYTAIRSGRPLAYGYVVRPTGGYLMIAVPREVVARLQAA